MSKTQEEIKKQLIENGVVFLDINNVYISEDTEIGKGTLVEPYVIFGKKVKIGENCHIKGFCHLEEAQIKDNTPVGPFARVRGNSVIGSNCNIGNFVEINRSELSDKAKAAHLTYVGDATVGYNTNIGAGVITCNYDGFSKNKTLIGENCFIGSNSILIAPVEVGNEAFVAAGSVVNCTIESDEFAIARSELRQIKNGASRYRSKKKSELEKKKS